MTDHDHMPPIHRYTARWLCDDRIVIVVDGREVPATWDEALSLATAITEALQLERRR
jgi:purine nucleoside permease